LVPQINGFPIYVFKKKKDEIQGKLQIKDVIGELIQIGHGTLQSKKELIDQIRGKYLELSKHRIETFVKECFEKEKRPPDSKVKIFNLISLDETLCKS